MQGLRTTIYKVPDLAAAKEWYARVFQVQPYFDEAFYVGFNIAGYELGLVPEPGAPKADNVLSYWGVDDIESEFNRIVALGASVHEKPTPVGSEIIVASIFDPWQNVIGLIYNPEFRLP